MSEQKPNVELVQMPVNSNTEYSISIPSATVYPPFVAGNQSLNTTQLNTTKQPPKEESPVKSKAITRFQKIASLAVTQNPGKVQQEQYKSHIKRLREKVVIYEYMCYQASSYYKKWNRIFLIPSLFITAMLALINATVVESVVSNETLKIINVAFNTFLTFLVSLKNMYKFSEKGGYFFNQKKKFTKLHNSLNNEVINQINKLHIEHDTIVTLTSEYDYLDENIEYEIPEHIRKTVKERFHHCSIPTICNGIEKTEEIPASEEKRKGLEKIVGLFKSNKKAIYSVSTDL